jgi:hypothetical protein
MSAFNADSDSGDVLERISPEETIELEDRRIEAREAAAAALEEDNDDYQQMVIAMVVDGEEFDIDGIDDCLTAAHVSPEEFAADLEKLSAEVRLSTISAIKSRARFAAAVRDRGPQHDRRSPILDLFKAALIGIDD